MLWCHCVLREHNKINDIMRCEIEKIISWICNTTEFCNEISKRFQSLYKQRFSMVVLERWLAINGRKFPTKFYKAIVCYSAETYLNKRN